MKSLLEKQLKTLHTRQSYISIAVGFVTVLLVGLGIYKYFFATVQKKAKSNQQTNKVLTQEKQINKEESYTVTKGERLWDIAVKVYGDGFAWVKIAKANNLSSPDTIHPGNVLIIPR